MPAKHFRYCKWITFGLSVLTTSLFFIRIGYNSESDDWALSLMILLGIVVAYLFNIGEQGLIEHFLLPWIRGQGFNLIVLTLLPVYGLDYYTTKVGINLIASEGFAIVVGLTLPWLFELFNELEKRAAE